MSWRASVCRNTGVSSSNEAKRPQGQYENIQARNNQLMDVVEQVGAEWDQEHFKSRSNSSEKPRCTKTHLDSRADAHRTVEKMTREAIDKLENWVTGTVGQTVVDALKTCDENHNMTFIKATLRITLNGILVFF